MKIVRPILILTIALALIGVAGAKSYLLPQTEQTVFSAEDEAVKVPAALPQGVVAILRSDEMVVMAMKNEQPQIEKLPSSWFSASVIHLGTPGETDFVVVGNPPLSGGNTATFWVIRSTPDGSELVLKAPAHDLSVKPTRAVGLRDIEMLAVTATHVHTVMYRLDGKSYKVFRDMWKPIQ